MLREFRHFTIVLFFSISSVWSGAQEASLNIGEMERVVEQTAAKVLPSVVCLYSSQSGASGSGTIVSKDGLILTAAHVVINAEVMKVILQDGSEKEAVLLGANRSRDTALLRLTSDRMDWPHVKLAPSQELVVGQWLVAVGHAGGFDPVRSAPVRFGRVVSNNIGHFFTTDCALIMGDSGGPIFDLEGRLVGVNSSIGTTSRMKNDHAGISGIHDDWQRLLAGDRWGQMSLNPFASMERPVLGVRLEEDRRGVVYVKEVEPGSPASKAGLRPYDILVQVDDIPIRRIVDLQKSLILKKLGESVTVSYFRGERVKKVIVKLEAFQNVFPKIKER